MTHSFTKNLSHAAILLAGVLLLAPRGAFAEGTLTLHVSQAGAGPSFSRTQTTDTGGSLSDGGTGIYSSISASASYGTLNVATTIDCPTGVDAVGQVDSVPVESHDFTTINTGNQPATARFTLHLDGDLTGFGESFGSRYFVRVESPNGNSLNFTGSIDQLGAQGTPPSARRTFIFDTPINPTQHLGLYLHMEQNSGGSGGNSVGGPPSTGHVASHLTLSSSGFAVLDAANQPMDYNSTSRTGSARAANVAAGAPFAGFAVTNTAPSRLSSALEILGGTPTTPAYVAASFIAPPSSASTEQTCGFFSDVPAADPLFAAVQCVNCRGIMTGYGDNTFRPLNNITRGQMARAVSREEAFTETVTTQTFEDVPPANAFYSDIERLAVRGVLSGFACGGPGEACIPPGNRDYFRPNLDATRGQLAKTIANAAGFSDAVTAQTFADVMPANANYVYIERLVLHGIAAGYACGGTGEPCDPQNRPYFRPNNSSARGELAQTLAHVHGICVTPPIQLASDVVDVTGTGSNPVVIQLSYKPEEALALFGSEGGLRLAYLDSVARRWFSAINGNGGGTPHFFARAYQDGTDFQVGNYGLDTVNHVAWAVINHNSQFAVSAVPDPLVVTSVVSRKTHGGAGSFDANLLGGVECRTGGASGNHMVILTFDNPVVSGNAAVTAGNGSVVGNPAISGNTMTVDLTGVVNAQRLTLTLSSVVDSNGQTLATTPLPLAFLVGDTNGNGSVTASDIGQTKSQSGLAATAANFREDLNVSGSISASDIGQAKAAAGTSLPASTPASGSESYRTIATR